jgi:glycosyltransferase involved in cell wall biosynthesis
MNILIGSYRFAPDVGGIETMSALMATEFAARGHAVRVVTRSAGDNVDSIAGVEVWRRPAAAELRASVRWCDVYWQNNISIELLPWSAPWRRPWVVTHQTWLAKAGGRMDWREGVKRLALRRATGVAISRALAAEVPGLVAVIPNCYDGAVFSAPASGATRDGELVFVGRLVSDKGADVLIEALARLAGEGVRPGLTLIGDGPERDRLRGQAEGAGVGGQVRWTGALQGWALAEELRRHRVMVVPSRWAEPFGIVALEGAACGCVVVGSREGGLADAIGPCGETFANGDAAALARVLERVLREGARVDAEEREAHLRRHTSGAVAAQYLRVFEEVLK